MDQGPIPPSDIIDGITDPNKLPRDDHELTGAPPGYCPYLGANYPPKTPLPYGGKHYICDPNGSGQWIPAGK